MKRLYVFVIILLVCPLSIANHYTLEELCSQYQNYLEKYLFDVSGVPLCTLDRITNKIFDQEYYETQAYLNCELFQGRADYAAYEDSWANVGMYMTALVNRYTISKETKSLDEINRMAELIVRVFDESQSIEPGFHKRLYGGIGALRKWEEPLGTDQHVFVLHGSWSCYDLLDEKMQEKIKRVTTESLLWYMRKGYRYNYRRAVLHGLEAEPGHPNVYAGLHALSYYIPALLWSYELTGEKRFIDDYEWLMDRYIRSADLHTHERAWVRWRGLFMASELAPEKDKKFFNQIIDNLMSRYMTVMERIADNNGIGPQYHAWLEPDWNSVMNPEVEQFKPDMDGSPTEHYRLGKLSRYCPLVQVSDMLRYAKHFPENAELDVFMRILLAAKTPSHFCMYYDPTDSIMPKQLEYWSRSVKTHSYINWLDAYYQLRILRETERGCL